MHDLDLPTYLMRAWPIISTRTRRLPLLAHLPIVLVRIQAAPYVDRGVGKRPSPRLDRPNTIRERGVFFARRRCKPREVVRRLLAPRVRPHGPRPPLRRE